MLIGAIILTLAGLHLLRRRFGGHEADHGAWFAPVIGVLAGFTTLVANAAKAAAQHGLHPARPPHWGGFRLRPDAWGFWQGRSSRLHDRLRYRLEGGHWVRERLAP